MSQLGKATPPKAVFEAALGGMQRHLLIDGLAKGAPALSEPAKGDR